MSADPPKGPDDDPDHHRPPERQPTDATPRRRSGAASSSSSTNFEVIELSLAPGISDDTEHPAHYEVESLPRGTQLGRYVLLGRVSDRSGEVVYGAYDPEGDRKVGLKLFHPGGDEGDNDDDIKFKQMRLVRQAQAVAKLTHPCVEQVYQVGVYGPWVFLATEFVDGINLRHWMEARDDPFPWPEVLRVFREAGRGLAAAHKQNIVHRDFRPANVIMGKEGRLVVVDFGLAHEMLEETDDIDLAELLNSMSKKLAEIEPKPMNTAGTPAYMAPEQHILGQATALSDQFSFCVALYEALYGERPFSGNRPRAIALEAAKHNVRPPPDDCTVPDWLRTIVVRGLSPQPSDRYPSMEALLRDLAHDPVASRRRWIWGAAIAGGLVVAGGLVKVQLDADRSACGESLAIQTALADAWNAEHREALHAAFSATERGWSEPTWAYTESKLDAWVDQWRDLSERACLATRVWGNDSEQHYEMRLACLDRHLSDFSSIVDTLSTVDGPKLDRAHRLALDLPIARLCTDTEMVLSDSPPNDDRREEIEALRHELIQLETHVVLNPDASVLEAITSIQPQLLKTGDDVLVARGQLLLGQIQLGLDSPEAESVLHQAALAALRANHSALIVQTWISRMEALQRDNRATEAVALGDYANAVVVRHASWLRTELDLARGTSELRRDRPAEALAFFHAAIEHEGIRGDTDRLRLVPAWVGQSDVLRTRGDLEGALVPLNTAIDVVHDRLGPHHPAAVPILQRLGQVEQSRSHTEQARLYFEQALKIVRQSQPDSLQRAELEGALGTIIADGGDAAQAIPYLEQAYRSRGGATAAREASGFQAGVALARTHAAIANTDAAQAILEAILAKQTNRAYASESPASNQPSANERSDAELLRAQLLWDAGQRSQARQIAAQLLAALGDSIEHQSARARVQQWVQEHQDP